MASPNAMPHGWSRQERLRTVELNIREAKAREIADRFRIVGNGERWLVPSQTGPGKYIVRKPTEERADCTCPDFETRREPCKHVLAVRYVIEQEMNPDGTTTVTETFEVTKRTTYPQDWPAYNKAQTTEQDYFQVLLKDLCSTVREPIQTMGRPRLPLADVIFASAYKIYSTFSGRRFMSDLREARKRGMIETTPNYNSIYRYLGNPSLTPIIKDLITQASLPLKAVETDFAADSSGFSTCRFERWFNHKYGKESFKREWVKVHIMCGVKTNVVTAVEIAGMHAADAPLLPPLLATTAESFTMREVSGDKGYLSAKNATAIRAVGARPYIAFKSNSTERGETKNSKAWTEMFHYFIWRRDEFLTSYHKRSNVETTFSMIKRKFGDSLRSKTDTAMVNEALCKLLCHNIVVLIHEMHELGIEPVFRERLLPHSVSPRPSDS
jgi:transposase